MKPQADVNKRATRSHAVCEGSLASRNGGDRVLITGGAGFIGTNLADALLTRGQKVTIFDNLSRPGSEANLAWLTAKHRGLVDFQQADIRDGRAIKRAIQHSFAIFHFAAQVAVTTSLVNPLYDFAVNAGGTLELLEAIRDLHDPPVLVFTSTNKVYGALEDVDLREDCGRYSPRNPSAIAINERRNLDFHSPYGCSKGAADQYVQDYAHTFRLPAVVFRMSCIYGPHQNGTEDQGWVAHFLIRANDGAPICIYGDGMQVRDLLFVEDLVTAFVLAVEHIERTSGHAFNIGGGSQNATSLLHLLELLGGIRGERPDVEFADWRPADQRYYVSDIRKFHSMTSWAPRTNIREGLERLQAWLTSRDEGNGTLKLGPGQSQACVPARAATVPTT
jgi:CDP-paratose 2-epimerase